MTIIVISNNSLLMESIRSELEEHCPGYTIIGNCYTVADGLSAIRALIPDIVLIDLSALKMVEFEKLKEQTKWNGRYIGITTSQKPPKKLGQKIIHVELTDIKALLKYILEA